MKHDSRDDPLRTFARTISHEPFGLAYHRPGPGAQPTQCFENVRQKVERDGGRIQYGWTFFCRLKVGIGQYLFANHHAVWNETSGNLIDVTPFHEEGRHRPITSNGDVLFQVDSTAQPVIRDEIIAPLPNRFFPIDATDEMIEYLDEESAKEKEACERIYNGDVSSATFTIRYD